MTDEKKIVCMRCKGRKKLYKVRAIYCFTNSGGVLVDCPLCNGEGKIKSLENELKDLADEKAKPKSRKKSEK